MCPSNSEGVPVDPVPFLVVTLLAGTVLVAFGPPYLMAFGVGVGVAVALCLSAALVATAFAYYRFVWTMNPLSREEVPAATRYLRLLYAIAALVVVVLALRGLLVFA